jgi:eukaryotic-like serine/threonine-protein kinase
MPPRDFHEIEEVFQAALELPTGERLGWLVEYCGSDAELRREVESLLAAEAESEEFLGRPGLLRAVGTLLGAEREVGQHVGSYKVVREIGRGGMGVVYLATRDDGKFCQNVAVKVVKRGFDTEDILRRFRNERQILASLNHPNIARLFDGGETADGLPYFVMEYAEGLPLLQYCDEHDLSMEGRLKLFRSVCAAVSHAHQNLVVHRDLKPSNILVTHAGEVKLLDFGVAKLLNPGSVGGGMTQTQALRRVMTPEYASPEQVRGQHVTTATDVYSLGVILYELLTGARPYELRDISSEELTRVICDSEPLKPSEAVTRPRATGAGTGGSENRAPHDPKSLKGDLDNIVLKALRKEPARRYKSADQFSEDVERHLKGLPVVARKDTFGYRASKFVGRNRVAIAAAGLVFLAVVTGLVVALWQADNVRRQRDLAQRERLRAERINAFLQRMLSFSNQSMTSVSPVAQRRDVTVNEMLDQIAPQIEAELGDQPDERAQVLRTIGSAYASQGRYDAADKHLRAALDVQTRVYGEDNAETVGTMFELGVLSSRRQKLDEAYRLIERAAGFYKRLRQAKSPEYNPAKLARAMEGLGLVKVFQGETKDGISLLSEALQIASGANLQGPEREVLASIKTDLGGALVVSGDLERGEALLRESLAEHQQLSSKPRWERGATLVMLGVAAFYKNQLDEAEKFLREGEQIYRQTLGEKNGYVAFAVSWEAAVLSRKNDLGAAEAKARESLAMSQDAHPDNKSAWVGTMWVLGDTLAKAGRAREAEDYYRQTLAIYEEQPKKNYPLTAQLRIRLSQSLLAQNRLPEAERVALEARDEAAQRLGEQSPLVKAAADNLTAVKKKRGKGDTARRAK